MLEHGGGSIVNAASALGEVGIVGRSAYLQARRDRTDQGEAALEHSARGIRVNAILPGLIQTPMVDAIEREQPGFVAELGPKAGEYLPDLNVQVSIDRSEVAREME